MKEQIEKALGHTLTRGWILDGAGPARYGWGSIHPCKTRWEGRTLREIDQRLKEKTSSLALAIQLPKKGESP